ncbi:hypothetical protein SAMN04487977_101499 [Treponema bryantii]|uniref:Uncharacterized protein n=1 Tax=Treponema bryantii TaxID=163 RepID=A0A1H9AWL9_9SPIR|nr:hypothetical protein [Treponema bryantii]SEP81184.1 hypothetical protein SAMN04487977_101499 [Treponema bryantii]
MTNRELLQKAMPLYSLSEEQWNEILEVKTRLSGSALSALETLVSNQAKLEVMTNYIDYFFDSLDKKITEKSFKIQTA